MIRSLPRTPRVSLRPLCLLAIAPWSAFSGAAGAAGLETASTAAGDSSEIFEVVVTARKRVEVLQEVPASISAIGADLAERTGLRDINDIAALTPGLSYTSLQGSNFALPVIRGLSTNVGESNVAFFVDGVYQGSRSGFDRLLTDIERIEVIKGPQVALYGRNAFAGAINVITRPPNDVFAAKATAVYGSEDRVEVNTAISGPLAGERLLYRLGAAYFERDGYYDNELTGTSLDERQTAFFSGALRFEPSDALVFDLRASYEDVDNGDNPGYFLLNNSSPPFAGRSQIYIGEVPARNDGFAVTPGGFERENALLSLTATWQMNDQLTLTSISSYNSLDTDFRLDNDYSANDISYQTQRIDQRELSQELRLAWAGASLDWLFGVYWYDLDLNTYDLDLVTQPANEVRLPASLRSTLIDNDETTETLAAFGSVDWRFARDLTLTVAARAFREKKTVVPFQSNPYTGVVLSPNPPLSDTSSFVTPSASLSWQPDADLLFYTSVARGVKAGGFNTLANVTTEERTYDSEESWNYELGAKTRWADGLATLNAALFYIDWRDQIVRALGSLGATLNANAGKTTSKGVELEAALRPFERLQFGASYTYTSAEFDDYVFTALRTSFGLDSDLAGKQLQYVPRHMASLSVDASQPLSNQWTAFFRVDGTYRARQYGTTTNLFYVGDSILVNAVLGLGNERLSFELWGRNLLDDDTPTTAISQRDRSSVLVPPAGQGVFKTLAFAPEPRSIGVRVKVRY